MRSVRGVLPAVLALALTTSGVTLLAAPVHARAALPSADPGTDPGSDWGDGAGHGFGRMGPKNARTTTVNPASGPDFELPFPCGQQWTGSSRSGHSPSYYSIDWNAPDDLGKPVVATAPGVVITARSLSGSYGRYVVIDHGNGYTSLYGHLNQIVGVVGQYVDQGDLIGYLGSTGNSTGPHLHFEERLDGAYFPPYFHRTTFRMGSTLTSANCTDRPVVADWNGDGTSDVGLFRNTPTVGVFYQKVGSAVSSVRWGQHGDSPVAADFDGDGLAQVGVRRQAGGTWYLRSSTGAVASVPSVGYASDTPLTGDWDGNGKASLGLYRPSNNTFYLRADDGTYTTVYMGVAGSRPIVGDWNGDGKDDLGVLSPEGGKYTLRVAVGTSIQWTNVGYGYSTDIPFAGDWNHDGRSELGVWRPSTAQFILRTGASTTGRYVNQVQVWGSRR